MTKLTAVHLYGPAGIEGSEKLTKSELNEINDLTYQEDEGCSFALGNMPPVPKSDLLALKTPSADKLLAIMEQEGIDIII